jgi:O-antigen/teichoic acid export membrane protein
MKEKIKALLTDSMWSIAGLMLMNVVVQFIVYPVWNNRLGSEEYGNILYLISIMNIIAISVGSACNYARMTESATKETKNINYTLILIISSIVTIPVIFLVGKFAGVAMTQLETVLFLVLTVLTMWRFYADVEYRLHLNYKGYFIYYLVISIGYLLGIFAFNITGLWALALIPGEIAGLVAVLLKGSILKKNTVFEKEAFISVFKVVIVLIVTDIISNLVFNGDRLVLKIFIDGTAVTSYYIASLLGKTMSLISTPLNSVIIGYLAKYKGTLNVKMMNIVTAASLAAVLIGTFLCTIASHILIYILYPQNYMEVRQFFIIANMSQVFYFVTNVITVVLLRFSKARYQLYINVVYAVAFIAVCIPVTMFGGNMWAFCVALLIVCILRMAASLFLGYKDAVFDKKTQD